MTGEDCSLIQTENEKARDQLALFFASEIRDLMEMIAPTGFEYSKH